MKNITTLDFDTIYAQITVLPITDLKQQIAACEHRLAVLQKTGRHEEMVTEYELMLEAMQTELVERMV